MTVKPPDPVPPEPMTRRDYFAAAALCGLLGRGLNSAAGSVARALQIADQMIEAMENE